MKTHISLNVSDVMQSVEFYSKMLGISPFKQKNDYAKFDVANPPLNLTMNQTNFERGGSLSHFGLQVETSEEVSKMSERWRKNGLLTLEEMQTDCCYALQDKTWISDPDGNRWEVFVVLENTENKEISASACCAPATAPISINRKDSCC